MFLIIAINNPNPIFIIFETYLISIWVHQVFV
jgi:hypothetical protein